MAQKAKKEKMAERADGKPHNMKDKGYKKLFNNKALFLEFLQTFVKEEWVYAIDESDLVRVDKEYILQDYRKKEADIVYRLKLKDPKTGEKKEVIFYLLLEIQSTVDRMMPYRMLNYMVQIWQEELKNVQYKDAQKASFRLPAIIPILLHNSGRKWTVPLNFKETLNEAARFGDHVVDFKYILVDVNSYNKMELEKIANAISIVVMMDQKIVAEDKMEFEERFKQIMKMKSKLPVEKLELILEWLQEVLAKRFPEEHQKEVLSLINGLKEESDMTFAIEKLFDKIEKKAKEEGREKGKEEGAIAIARASLKEGINPAVVSKITGLDMMTVQKLKMEIEITEH